MVVSHSQSTYFLEFSRVTPLRNGLATKQPELTVFLYYFKEVFMSVFCYTVTLTSIQHQSLTDNIAFVLQDFNKRKRKREPGISVQCNFINAVQIVHTYTVTLFDWQFIEQSI